MAIFNWALPPELRGLAEAGQVEVEKRRYTFKDLTEALLDMGRLDAVEQLGILYDQDEYGFRKMVDDREFFSLTDVTNGFMWSATQQGQQYWQELCDEVAEYQRGV